jgi:predicted 3-demethylubiquinone-9 3-methyltransferase (glyoxalase superfamily)
MSTTNNPITVCLWFDGKAKEAATFYCSVFKNARITTDTPMVVTFELNGRKFMGLNGGPNFTFTEAISLVIECETQEEIDYYWGKLTEGGQEGRCGWLKDRYGLSWQVVPTIIGQLMREPSKGERVMQAILTMNKLDIATLQEA